MSSARTLLVEDDPAAQIAQVVALARAQGQLVSSRERTMIRLVRAIELREVGVAEHAGA